MTKVSRIYEEMRLDYGKQEAEKARVETLYDNICKMMNSFKLSLEEAMNGLEVSEADRAILMKRF